MAHLCEEHRENNDKHQASPGLFHRRVLPDPPRQAKAHLISVIGGDTQVSAVSAAISMGDRFMVEGPDVQPIRVCLERNAQCLKGSIQLAGRKKPLRHLIGMSEEFASGNASARSGRTLLAGSDCRFVWASIAHIYGIPGIPERIMRSFMRTVLDVVR